MENPKLHFQKITTAKPISSTMQYGITLYDAFATSFALPAQNVGKMDDFPLRRTFRTKIIHLHRKLRLSSENLRYNLIINSSDKLFQEPNMET